MNIQQGWQQEIPLPERQRLVQALVQTLKLIQGDAFNAQKGGSIAQEFERNVFQRSGSKQEYINYIREKVQQLRAGALRRTQQQQPPKNNSFPMGQQQQSQSNLGGMNQPQQQRGGMMYGGGQEQQQQPTNQVPAMQNQRPIQQQQQKVQPIQQPNPQMGGLQRQQQQQVQGSNQPQGMAQQNFNRSPAIPTNQMTGNNNPSMQFNLRNFKNLPIPQSLLQKIPGLPANVRTWADISECMTKNQIPQSLYPTIKEIHEQHAAYLARQMKLSQLNQQQQQQGQGQSQGQPGGGVSGVSNQGMMKAGNPMGMMNNSNTNNNTNNNTNTNGGNVQNVRTTPIMGNSNFNMNNLTPQQKQMLQRQMQHQQQQQQQQQGSNNDRTNVVPIQQLPMMMNKQLNPNQRTNNNNLGGAGVNSGNLASNLQMNSIQQQKTGNMGGGQQQQQQQQPQIKVPEFPITDEDVARYTPEAMAYFVKYKGGLPPVLAKEKFIRKYIQFQKTQLWKQKNGLLPNQQNRGGVLPQQQQQQQQQQQAQQQSRRPTVIGNGGPVGGGPIVGGNQMNGPASNNQILPNTAITNTPQVQQQQPIVRPNNQQMNPQSSPMMGNLQSPLMTNTQLPVNSMQSPLIGQKSMPMNQSLLQQSQLQQRQQGMQPGRQQILPQQQQQQQQGQRLPQGQQPQYSMPQNKQQFNQQQQPSQMRQQQAQVGKPVMQLQQLNQQQSQLPQGQQQQRPSMGMPNMITDTQEFNQKLKQIVEDVSRNAIRLQDVSQKLNDQDKNAVREASQKISQQFANIDNVIKCFFMLTGDVEGTRRIFHAKHMVKNISEGLNRGIYLAIPEMMEKLAQQLQKYFDFVKLRMPNLRASMTGQLQQQQQQQQLQGLNKSGNQTLQPQQIPQGMQNRAQYLQQQQQQPLAAPLPQSAPPLIKNTPPIQPAAQPSNVDLTKAKKPSISAASSQSRRRASSVKNAPTPGGSGPVNATTPATLASAIKTPNSLPTPQVPQSYSNKNTPMGNSPSYIAKTQSTSNGPQADITEIFRTTGVDAKSARRRELSSSDPEKFFLAAMANLLELDSSVVDGPSSSTSLDGTGTTKRTISSSIKNGNEDSKTGLNSPLSPMMNALSYNNGVGSINRNSDAVNEGWTCEIRPAAITSAFKQVELIRDLVSTDVIATCSEMAQVESPNGIEVDVSKKRTYEMMEDDEDIDMLFGEPINGGGSSQSLYEPMDLESWRSFVTANSQ